MQFYVLAEQFLTRNGVAANPSNPRSLPHCMG